MLGYILGGIGIWLASSAVCFRIWCMRGKIYTFPDRTCIAEYMYDDHDCKHNQCYVVVGGSYVRGWSSDNDPFHSLKAVQLLSFLLWIPITIMWSVKYIGLFIYLVVSKLYMLTIPSLMPVPDIALPPTSTTDPLMVAALKEVELIAPESTTEPFTAPHKDRSGNSLLINMPPNTSKWA